MEGVRGRRIGETAVCAALACLCAAVYMPALSNGFVWDDELFLGRNPAVANGLTAESLRWAFTTFYTGNWYPLTWVSHLLDVDLFGFDPAGHHLVNVLFHGANAVLTFLLFRQLTGALWASALVAALFAAHPLHVESVAWVAERKDVLSTLLWLLALLAWVGWLRRPGAGRYAAAVALYALALMAKAMPVSLPFLLLLLDWWPIGRFVPGRRAAVIAEKLPLFVLAGLSGAVAWLAQSGSGAVGSVPLPVRLANVVLSYWRYVGKALWPTDLALLYPFPTEEPHLVGTVSAAAALAAVTFLVLRVRRRSPALPVGWFWFLGTLVPVIGFVQIGTQAMADRYTYVPLTGLFIMAIWGTAGRPGRRSVRMRWLAAFSVPVIALLAVAARAQVRTWHDPATAFENALRVTKDNLIAHTQLAGHYNAHGDSRRAEEHARAAISISAEDAGAHGSLAQTLGRSGKAEEAIAEYRAALRYDPRSAEALTNLAALLHERGDLAEAEADLRLALDIRPAYPAAHSNLGKLLAKRGRVDEALPYFREAARLSPRAALYLGDLGAALAALGREEEGVPFLEEALRLDPGLETARENLAKARSRRAPRR